MLSQTIRTTRHSIVRLARQHASLTHRSFGTTTIKQADLVQDMYLNQLKNYKVPPVKASDAEGQVHKFNPPKPPHTPEQANDGEVKEYEQQTVETEMTATSGESSVSSEKDWFEEDEFGEDEKEAHH